MARASASRSTRPRSRASACIDGFQSGARCARIRIHSQARRASISGDITCRDRSPVVRVLELARILAGPWAGQILADLGADVIKIERTGAGDDTRGWGPPFVEGADGKPMSRRLLPLLQSRQALGRGRFRDRGRPAHRARSSRRAPTSCIENFKTGGLAKFGLDYASLSKENPRIIYCSITGFGQDGPYAHRAGYDLLVQGMGGIMDLTGQPDGEPMRGGVAFADVMTGIYSALAITAALNERNRTGKGSYIDMALLDTQVAVLANQASSYLVSGKAPKRMGNAHPAVVPYQVFPVADGHVIIACGNDTQFARLIALLGAPEMAQDERYTHQCGPRGQSRHADPARCSS